MARKIMIMLVAAAGLSVIGMGTQALARGGGHGGGMGGMHGMGGMRSTFNPLIQEMIPRITPQFNSPGARLTPPSSGNPRGPLLALPNGSGYAADGGGLEPNVSRIPRKENSTDAAMDKADQQFDQKLETEICRGC